MGRGASLGGSPRTAGLGRAPLLPPWTVATALGRPCFGQPGDRCSREAIVRPARRGAGATLRDAQAGVPSAGWPRAQLAFKDSMVHGILQFTPSIAFRYVLHRCESRDIRCRESFPCVTKISHPHEKWLKIQPNVQCVATSPLPPQDNRTP